MPTNTNVTYYPEQAINDAVQQFETPFFLYEENRLIENCNYFRDTFRRYFPDFEPLFAVKANPNPTLLKLIQDQEFGFDCSSESESWIVNRLQGFGMYTGNYTTERDLAMAKNAGLILNLDDISLIPILEKIGVPEVLSFRVNPGITKGGFASLEVAGPNAKFGIPMEQAIDAYKKAKSLGVQHFGMHIMAGSNVLDENHFVQLIDEIFPLIAEIKEELGIEIEFLNIGGGFGVPYQPEEQDLDLEKMVRDIRESYDKNCILYNLSGPRLMAEPGRFISANAGWLVSKVIGIKDAHKKFVGIDATTTMMPRTAIYDAYHHISVINNQKRSEDVSIVGRLCENNDFFAHDRNLPKINIDDLVVIHNCGGHASAMASNYNGFIRPAEYLLKVNGDFEMIRRAETVEDLYSRSDL
ncbi:diaminopimelate decarboxylase [Patescibacteria group bacterium]